MRIFETYFLAQNLDHLSTEIMYSQRQSKMNFMDRRMFFINSHLTGCICTWNLQNQRPLLIAGIKKRQRLTRDLKSQNSLGQILTDIKYHLPSQLYLKFFVTSNSEKIHVKTDLAIICLGKKLSAND